MGDPLKRLRQLHERSDSLPTSKDELVTEMQDYIQAKLTAEEERVNNLGKEAEEAIQLADQVSTRIRDAGHAVEDARRFFSEVK